MTLDKLHAVLIAICIILAGAAISQASQKSSGLSDAERYKRFSAWALNHGEVQTLRYIALNEQRVREIESYLSSDAREHLRSQGKLSLPGVPVNGQIKEAPVDMETFKEVMQYRRTGR